jgi:hypothetical protein
MTAFTHQTVTISRGRHESPASGACVVELASLLAGERFTDHPLSVCPVIAGFLRDYNDLLADGERDELYPYAALVVGTAASGRARRERARLLLDWAGIRVRGSGLRLRFPLRTWDVVLVPVARAAVRMDRRERPRAVGQLMHELVAIGRPASEPIPDAVPPVAAETFVRSR